MALQAQAALLDELMGRNRDINPDSKHKEIHWDDAETCKYYLCGFCPHDLFVNTRADLGPCDKIHDDELRKIYEKSTRFEKMGYEEDFIRFLQSLVNDVERRIRRGQQRLTLNSQQAGLNAATPQMAKEEKIEMLTQRINELVEQAGVLGCEGKVEEAQGVMKLCDQLKTERTQLENNEEQAASHSNEQLKDMEVCSVCGALLIVNDAPQRVDEHLMGKQHVGYAQIRAQVEGFQKKLQNQQAERESKLRKEREDREKEREKEREDRRKKIEEREKERRKSRSRSRDRSRGSRSKDRDRRRGRRSRSRSRDKKRRSRSRDRHRRRSRSRSRDRSHRSGRRSRSRDRHSRHSSRDKDRRSRSEDKEHRSRSEDKERGKEGRDSKERDGESNKKEESEVATNEVTENGEGEHETKTDETIDTPAKSPGSAGDHN